MAITPRILVFAGSLRSGAYSRKTADVAQKLLSRHGAEVNRISLGDYPLPLVDEDLEKEKGVPENAVKLARMFTDHDGILICTPEYNGSIPPLVKNTIDWISRCDSDRQGKLIPYNGKAYAICSSSSGHFAGIRSANHLRAVLAHIQADVIAPQVSVPDGGHAFDEAGNFREERLQKSMDRLAKALVERAAMTSTRT